MPFIIIEYVGTFGHMYLTIVCFEARIGGTTYNWLPTNNIFVFERAKNANLVR
jgi:hypothetical protein